MKLTGPLDRYALPEFTESKLTLCFENSYATLLIPAHYSGQLPTIKMAHIK